MTTFTLIHNLVEKNGKTIRENNLQITHSIAIGTLVEVNCHHQPEHKTRQFIASHGRDCDGTPLYSLTPKRDMCDDQITMDEMEEPRSEEYITIYRNLYHNGGWGADSLIVVES